MSYGKVHDSYLDGEKIKPVSDRAALLGLYLIFGPHRNAIGCFKLGRGAIMDVPRFDAWGIEGVSEALRELTDTGFILRDNATGWTFITNALVKDPLKGPKAAVHAAKLADDVPADSPVYKALKEVLEPQIKAELKGEKCKIGWPMRSPIEGVSMPNRSPKPSPISIPVPEPQALPVPAPVPAPKIVDKKSGDAKEPASRALRTRAVDTSDPANRKAVWEQKCVAWMTAHWTPERTQAAIVAYLEGNPDGKLEYELASAEMGAEKTDGSIRAETRIDRQPGTPGSSLPTFDRERALDIPEDFRRSA